MSTSDATGRCMGSDLHCSAEAEVTSAAPTRADLTPSSTLPLAYFAFAHAGLASGFVTLAFRPDLPGVFFYHPKMVAIVHLLTLPWLSGSILGAFYIVAPLVLRLPMPVRWPDWIAFALFVLGTAGMVGHFWIGEYGGMVWGAYEVVAAIGWVASRAWRGLVQAPVPWPIKLHVGLAFANIVAAAALGILIGIDRTRGILAISPIAATYTHAHLAAIGWATMMVVGLAYRLIPMMLPAAMPTGSALARSALLLQAGLVVIAWALIHGSPWLLAGAALVAAGLASFFAQIRSVVGRRMPKPPALPRRDWSTWQTHTALLWLVVAVVLGVAQSVGVRAQWTFPMMWLYGVAALVGFLAQIVTGMQGRLVPLYAWYRAMARRGGAPPARGANDLPSAAFARVVFLTWTAGVPLLGWGLAVGAHAVIVSGAILLACGVAAGGAHIAYMVRKVG